MYYPRFIKNGFRLDLLKKNPIPNGYWASSIGAQASNMFNHWQFRISYSKVLIGVAMYWILSVLTLVLSSYSVYCFHFVCTNYAAYRQAATDAKKARSHKQQKQQTQPKSRSREATEPKKPKDAKSNEKHQNQEAQDKNWQTQKPKAPTAATDRKTKQNTTQKNNIIYITKTHIHTMIQILPCKVQSTDSSSKMLQTARKTAPARGRIHCIHLWESIGIRPTTIGFTKETRGLNHEKWVDMCPFPQSY